MYPLREDIWWVQLDPTVGTEIKKKQDRRLSFRTTLITGTLRP